MQIVSIEEIIEHKILPFDIYSEFGEKIFSAGEALTPGKLLQLKHFDALYKNDGDIAGEEDSSDEILTSLDSSIDFGLNKKNTLIEQEENIENKNADKTEKNDTQFVVKQVVEEFDMNPSTIKRNKLSVDDIDISNYKGPINKDAKIEPQTQLKIKAYYQK